MRTENVQKLRSQIREYQSRLMHLADEEMQRTLGPGRWSGRRSLAIFPILPP